MKIVLATLIFQILVFALLKRIEKKKTMLRLVVVAALVALAAEAQLNSPVRGVQCSRNQSVNKLTVYEDGAIEAECGPIPCGRTTTCADEMATSCKPETELYAGMRWAKNGQSLLLRCCGAEFPSKTYIGTDLVPLGSYYGVLPDFYKNKYFNRFQSSLAFSWRSCGEKGYVHKCGPRVRLRCKRSHGARRPSSLGVSSECR